MHIETKYSIGKKVEKSTKWKYRFRVEDTAMWQHILELIVEDRYPTFIIRYVNIVHKKFTNKIIVALMVFKSKTSFKFIPGNYSIQRVHYSALL